MDCARSFPHAHTYTLCLPTPPPRLQFVPIKGKAVKGVGFGNIFAEIKPKVPPPTKEEDDG